MEEEIWKDVEGFEGYKVSSFGRIKSFKHKKAGRILKLPLKAWGYFQTTLFKLGKPKFLSVHKLVALAFIPNPENKPEVNHIDGNKTNNNVQNLEWVTLSENSLHAFKIGLSKKGKDRKNWKSYINIYSKTGEFLMQTVSLQDAAKWIRENTKYIKADRTSVCRACNGRCGIVYGCRFKRTHEKKPNTL
jgi:hypothetical protein